MAGGDLQIGALTRHAQLLDDAAAGAHFAILHDAEKVIADPVVRNWGTVGGSLCQADPSEDLSAAFTALKATSVALGRTARPSRAEMLSSRRHASATPKARRLPWAAPLALARVAMLHQQSLPH